MGVFPAGWPHSFTCSRGVFLYSSHDRTHQTTGESSIFRLAPVLSLIPPWGRDQKLPIKQDVNLSLILPVLCEYSNSGETHTIFTFIRGNRLLLQKQLSLCSRGSLPEVSPFFLYWVSGHLPASVQIPELSLPLEVTGA